MRKRLIYLACAIAALAVLVIAAPRRRDESGCLFCGRMRVESWWCGFKVRDQIHEREWSNWVDSLHPGHTNHIWGISSRSHKRWFGGGSIGCGGVGGSGVAQIHFAKNRIGDERAVELLSLYHFQVETNRAALHKFLQQELGSLP